MRGILRKSIAVLGCICVASLARGTETPSAPYQVLISVPDQKLALVKDGECVARYPISTSRFGTGDNFGSYRTPLGALKVCDKIGDNLSPGAVIRHRSATGEVIAVNAPGRDPIVTRVIWLDGLEAQNQNARTRGIYIHGTPEERTIGTPVSWGCIRMRSKDVIKVFEEVPVGTLVSIIPAKLPHMHRYEPSSEVPVTAPEPAVPKPASPLSDKPAAIVAQVKPTPSLPPIAEAPGHGGTSALREMKGSILLANIPGTESQKPHGGKATQ